MPGRNRFGEELKFLDFQKGGTKILKISKGEEPEKNLGWRKPEGGERFSKQNEGNPNFQVDFRDKKGRKWGLLETNELA